ncbi:hypothetical protein Fmac_010633 [Flemingia macrophylla]|uniref:Uncharacterized protein n=1 Tax=Flemingia macrophylla TaxID=520843 RepID=A0ABD1MK55_9FABA
MRERGFIPDLNQPTLPDLNYPPPPHYSYQQLLWNVDQVIEAATEGSTDTTAASKTKTVEEPESQNSSCWFKIKEAFNISWSRLYTIIKNAPAE